MAVTQVASYERESGGIAGGASGTLTLATGFIPAAGETVVVWFMSGTEKCQPSGAPAVSGGITWTQRAAVALTSTCAIYCWTGVAPAAPTTVNPAVPYAYTGTTTTAAHLTVQRFSGTTLPATPNTAKSAAAATTSGTGGATLPITTASAGSGVAWAAADWNGVISGAPTTANGDTLAQSYLYPTAGILADWNYWRTQAAAGATTVGFTGFATTGTRKLTFAALELPPTPVAPTTYTSARAATFDSGTVPASALSVTYGGTTVVNGRMRVPATNTTGAVTNFAGAETFDQANGTDHWDDFFFQVTQVTGSGAGNAAPSMGWVYAASQPAGTRIGWEYDPNAGTLSAKYQVGYADAGAVALTYSPTTHGWWRVRNSGTQVVWETSPSGTAGSWVTARTLATPTWANGADLSFTIEAYRTTGVTDFFEIDNLNTAPVSGVYWRPDYTKADVVAAGYWDSGSQRENGAGTFNDPTVTFPFPIQAAPYGRPGRAIPFSIPTNYIRAETEPPEALNAFDEGADYWFGFAFALAPGFPLTGTSWQVIEQLHGGPGQGSPPVAFEARQDGLRLTGGWGKPKPDGTNWAGTYAYDLQLLATLQTSRWYNVVFRVHFSETPATSRVDVWADGTQVVTNFSPPCATVYGTATAGVDGGPTYLKMGIYHDPAYAAASLWHTGDAIGLSYADVDPTPGSLAAAGTAVSGSRATLTGRRIAPIPSSPATGADALQSRTLTEIRIWEQWLSAHSADGLVGEFGVPSVWARFGDQPQQTQWTALLAAYLSELDRAGIHSAVWASGRNWNVDYTVGLHTPTTKGAALDTRLATVTEVAAHPSRNARFHGINLSGWEEGVATGNTGAGNVRPGTSYPPQANDLAFIAADGIDFVRLPLAWERLQPTLGAALDTTALSQLDTLLVAARANGISVMLDLHNYGRYTLAGGTLVALGSAQLTSAHLADFWSRMVTWVGADANRASTVVALGLMNEPHDLPGGAATWQAASQAAVTAIRSAVN